MSLTAIQVLLAPTQRRDPHTPAAHPCTAQALMEHLVTAACPSICCARSCCATRAASPASTPAAGDPGLFWALANGLGVGDASVWDSLDNGAWVGALAPASWVVAWGVEVDGGGPSAVGWDAGALVYVCYIRLGTLYSSFRQGCIGHIQHTGGQIE
ncbi:hypothetical protein BD779DRAFT_1787927 [Infundibulicybe gibba]|nr:hypothetical protein BD779DRAFT_1787927 [Infundibulicybe gibba]